MLRTFAFGLVFFGLSLANASSNSVEEYFSKLSGQWNFVSSHDTGFNADGTIWRQWEMSKHVTAVGRNSDHWNVFSVFCTNSPGQELCSEAHLQFKTVGDKLFVVIPEDSPQEIPVEILSSSPTGIVIKYSVGTGMVMQSENISPEGLWSQVIQVYSKGRLSAVQTVTSKKIEL